jgi:hypothetical protein
MSSFLWLIRIRRGCKGNLTLGLLHRLATPREIPGEQRRQAQEQPQNVHGQSQTRSRRPLARGRRPRSRRAIQAVSFGAKVIYPSFARSLLGVMPACSPRPVARGSTSDAPAWAAGSSTTGQVAEGRTMAGQVTGKGTDLQEFESQLPESRSASPLNSTEPKKLDGRRRPKREGESLLRHHDGVLAHGNDRGVASDLPPPSQRVWKRQRCYCDYGHYLQPRGSVKFFLGDPSRFFRFSSNVRRDFTGLGTSRPFCVGLLPSWRSRRLGGTTHSSIAIVYRGFFGRVSGCNWFHNGFNVSSPGGP